MPAEEKFDLSAFVYGMRALSDQDRQQKLREEMERIGTLVVRDPGLQFQQQLYLQRLKRLSRFLTGEKIPLTPVEVQAYVPLGRRPAAQAPVAPGSTPAAAPAERPGSERRTSRRIALKTWVRVRRASDSETELVEPVNVSRGGLCFQSIRQYDLHDIIWIKMHCDPEVPESGEMETRCLIVRAAPVPEWEAFSYGLKFL